MNTFLIILAIVIVGYFIIKAAIPKVMNVSSSPTMPISQRIAVLKESSLHIQSYLSQTYRKELNDYSKKVAPFHDKTIQKIHQDAVDDLSKLVEINSKLCIRYKDNEQYLLEELLDWHLYLEQLRDAQFESDHIQSYIEYGLDLPEYDDVAIAERRGIIHETYKRIASRAKSEAILEKRLIPSFAKYVK